MGSCHCRQVVASYEIKKIGQSEISPSADKQINEFDSLPSSRSVPGSKHVVHSPSAVKISPRDFVEVSVQEKAGGPVVNGGVVNESLTSDLTEDYFKAMAVTDGRHLEEGVCRSISSGSVDSLISSETLSLAYSSPRGNGDGRETMRQISKTSQETTLSCCYEEEDDKIASLQRVIETMNSRDYEEEALDSVGYLPGEERPYLNSRLDNRAGSELSDMSLDCIQWKKGNRLGRGTFGTVYLGLTITGELLAVKQIELIGSDVDEIEKEYNKIYHEVSLLKNLRHKNIVGYVGSNYENNCISVFMEYVPGGSLSSIIQRFGPLEEPVTIRYSKQLLEAVAFLHDNNVVHRDIKSANLMLMPDSTVKLIDFGCAKRLALRLSRSGSHLQKSLRGTPYWMAPEVINESGHGKKSDIWSMGCTCYELLTGKPPWGDREPIAAIYAIGSDDFEVPSLPERFSADAQEFVHLCLIRDKHKRPGAKRLLQHHFVCRPSSNTSITLTRGDGQMSSIRRKKPDDLVRVS